MFRITWIGFLRDFCLRRITWIGFRKEFECRVTWIGFRSKTYTLPKSLKKLKLSPFLGFEFQVLEPSEPKNGDSFRFWSLENTKMMTVSGFGALEAQK